MIWNESNSNSRISTFACFGAYNCRKCQKRRFSYIVEWGKCQCNAWKPLKVNEIQNLRWSIRFIRKPKTHFSSSLQEEEKGKTLYFLLSRVHSLKCLLGSIIKTGWLMVSLKLRCWNEEHEAIIPDCPQKHATSRLWILFSSCGNMISVKLVCI